jgi:hypothetical protein
VLSSIELIYPLPGQNPVMSDDWKWVLRTASATRPVLRFLPSIDMPSPAAAYQSITSAFSDTRGVVQLSAGADGFVSSLGNAPDLGTAFAVATSVYGRTQLQLVGDLGYSSRAGIPTGAFRTTFSREFDSGAAPEVTVTMRQLFLPGRAGLAALGGPQNQTPELRTMDVSFGDHLQLSDNVQFDYGASMESISFLSRLNYLSPYGRLTYEPSADTVVELVVSSGAPPDELLRPVAGDPASDLQQNLATLALFPRVSLLAGRPEVQRSSNYELGYHRKFGSRAVSLAAYREVVSNTAVTAAGIDGLYPTGDVLPDLFSETSVLNAGRFFNTGYIAGISQDVGDDLSFGFAYGSGDALKPTREQLETGGADELRSILRTARRPNATARVNGTLPWTGTHVMSSYEWTDFSALTPGHAYLTQGFVPLAGLNVRVRQPLPLFCRRLELNAEFRNLLAQGYVPVLSPGGRRFYLMQAARGIRGGLNFVF